MRLCLWLAERHVFPVLVWSFALCRWVPWLAADRRWAAGMLLLWAVAGVVLWRVDGWFLREQALNEAEQRR